MCQGCVEQGDLSQSTYDAIDRFLVRFPNAEYGFAHVVLADCNVDNACIRACLDSIIGVTIQNEDVHTVRFLEWLLTTPEEDR